MNPHFADFYELTILYTAVVSLIAAKRILSLTRISREMTPVESRTDLGEDLRVMWLGFVGFLAMTGVFYTLRFLAGDGDVEDRIAPPIIYAVLLIVLNVSTTVILIKSGPVNTGMRALLAERNAKRAAHEPAEASSFTEAVAQTIDHTAEDVAEVKSRVESIERKIDEPRQDGLP